MKRFLLLTGIVCSVLSAEAQVHYGIKGGLNLSDIGGADAGDNKMKIGYHIGGFVKVPVADQFSVQPELVFSAQGFSIKEDGDNSKLNANYINLPLLASYSFGKGLYAEAGPRLGFLLSAKVRNEGESTNVKDDFKKLDFAWVLGIGYQLQEKLSVNARFNLGLSKLDKEGHYKTFNRVIQAGIQYTLGKSTGIK